MRIPSVLVSVIVSLPAGAASAQMPPDCRACSVTTDKQEIAELKDRISMLATDVAVLQSQIFEIQVARTQAEPGASARKPNGAEWKPNR